LIILDHGTRWRSVISLTPLPLYLRGNGPQYPLHRRLRGPHSRSERCEEARYLFLLPGIEPRSSSSRTDHISGVTEKPCAESPHARGVADTIIQPLNPAVQKSDSVYNAPRVLAFHLFRLMKSRLVFKGNYFENKMCMMKV
jgi:hypothetical protein